MDALRKAGDSCGARIQVVARGMPAGLGEPLHLKHALIVPRGVAEGVVNIANQNGQVW